LAVSSGSHPTAFRRGQAQLVRRGTDHQQFNAVVELRWCVLNRDHFGVDPD
jgi:hypothetical protein